MKTLYIEPFFVNFIFLQIGYKKPSSTITDSQGIFNLPEDCTRGGKKIGQKSKNERTTSVPHKKRDEKPPQTPKTPKKPPKPTTSDASSSDEEYRSRYVNYRHLHLKMIG